MEIGRFGLNFEKIFDLSTPETGEKWGGKEKKKSFAWFNVLKNFTQTAQSRVNGGMGRARWA